MLNDAPYNLTDLPATITEAYEHLVYQLKSTHEALSDKRTFQELVEDLKELFSREYTGFDLLGGAPFSILGQPPLVSYVEASMAFALEARDADSEGNTMKAWPHLMMAYYCLGHAHGAFPSVASANIRAEKYAQFDEGIIDLLRFHCPKGLWDNVEQARQAILPDLIDYYYKQPKADQIFKDLEESLERRSKGNLRSAFERHVKEIKPGRPKKKNARTSA